MNSNKQNIHTSSLKLENTIKGMKGRIAVKDAFASLNGKVTMLTLTSLRIGLTTTNVLCYSIKSYQTT